MRHQTLLHDKFQESLASVLPITIIVLLLCFTVAPIPNNMLVSFLMGAVLLIVGMAFFTLGADTAMTPIGTKVGSCITKSRKIWMIVFVSFLLGVIITISEPDLQVLANQVPNIPNAALIGTVALGVGIFLIIAMLRILFGISLNILLIGFYIVVFLMAMFVPKNFWAVAFDSGGVASGPMTATFLLPFAIGACDAVGGNVVTDAFGIVAMVAMTPLITIQVLGVLTKLLPNRRTRKMPEQAVWEVHGDYEIIEW